MPAWINAPPTFDFNWLYLTNRRQSNFQHLMLRYLGGRHSEFHWNQARLSIRFMPPCPVHLFGETWYHVRLLVWIWQHWINLLKISSAGKHHPRDALISKSTKWPWKSMSRSFIFNRLLCLTMMHIWCEFDENKLIFFKSWADKV